MRSGFSLRRLEVTTIRNGDSSNLRGRSNPFGRFHELQGVPVRIAKKHASWQFRIADGVHLVGNERQSGMAARLDKSVITFNLNWDGPESEIPGIRFGRKRPPSGWSDVLEELNAWAAGRAESGNI